MITKIHKVGLVEKNKKILKRTEYVLEHDTSKTAIIDEKYNISDAEHRKQLLRNVIEELELSGHSSLTDMEEILTGEIKEVIQEMLDELPFN